MDSPVCDVVLDPVNGVCVRGNDYGGKAVVLIDLRELPALNCVTDTTATLWALTGRRLPNHYSAAMYSPANVEAPERAHKENLGQFLTPVAVSDFIASFLTALPAHVRLLD